MIGLVVEAQALLALGVVELAVAGDHGAVREAHDERRVVAPAVGVDQQPRVARHHGRRAERGRERAHDRRDADVVGDVALELLGRQAERAVVRAGRRCRRGRRARSGRDRRGPAERNSCRRPAPRWTAPAILDPPWADYSRGTGAPLSSLTLSRALQPNGGRHCINWTRTGHYGRGDRTTPTDARTLLALFDAAVAAAHPDVCLPAHLPPPPERRPAHRRRRRQGGRRHGGRRRAHYRALGVLDRVTGFTTAPHGTAEALPGERPRVHPHRLGAPSDARRQRASRRPSGRSRWCARRPRTIWCWCCCPAAPRRCGRRRRPASTSPPRRR